MTNLREFLSAATTERTDLLGYIEVKTTALERTRAANGMFTAPGVTFTQEQR